MSGPAGKTAVRAAMRARRRSLALEHPNAAVEAADRYAKASPAPPRVTALYHPLGDELDPQPLAAILRASGATLALPVTLAKGAPLAFRRWTTEMRLVPDACGVPAPGGDAVDVVPDLLVVPLLAFDRTGARLGQGGGHYDRTLQALRARGRVFVLGLAYAGQQVDALAVEAHDQRLDAVLTEAALTRFDL